MKRYDPITPTEIQEAVNLAQFFLLLHASAAYGLVTHPYNIDVARCERILKSGAAVGIAPQETTVDAITKEFAKQATQ